MWWTNPHVSQLYKYSDNKPAVYCKHPSSSLQIPPNRLACKHLRVITTLWAIRLNCLFTQFFWKLTFPTLSDFSSVIMFPHLSGSDHALICSPWSLTLVLCCSTLSQSIALSFHNTNKNESVNPCLDTGDNKNHGCTKLWKSSFSRHWLLLIWSQYILLFLTHTI